MKIIIDAEKLDLLLQLHHTDIWMSKIAKGNNLLQQLLLLISVYMASFPHYTVAYVFYCITGVSVVWSIFIMCNSDSYSVEQLHKDIKGLNEITDPYSLIVIKDTFNASPNRYLVYYDKKWKCKFFLNYKTKNENNEEYLRAKLASELKVAQESIKIEKKAERIQKKYNPQLEHNKTYYHTLYYVELANIPEGYKQAIFSSDDRTFYWMTLEEMELDKDIQEKNLEVVSFVKDVID